MSDKKIGESMGLSGNLIVVPQKASVDDRDSPVVTGFPGCCPPSPFCDLWLVDHGDGRVTAYDNREEAREAHRGALARALHQHWNDKLR